MNVKDIKKILIYTMLVVVCVGMFPIGALADGSGDLGAPSITIASGTKLLAAGDGMALFLDGQIYIDVPLGASVEQVLLYWVGRGTPDGSITVNGTSVSGTLIGSEHSGSYTASGFRANITDLGLVTPGSNTLNITDMKFGTRNDGASVLVIIKDGPYGFIEIRDGMDYAYYDNPPGDLQETTKETFTFPSAPILRSANLTLLLGDGTADRPDRIVISIGTTTTTLYDLAVGSDGAEWDTIIRQLDIPAGVDEVSVQLFSDDLSPSFNSDSLSWVAAALSIEPIPLASIGDYVWNDINEDGIQDSEPGVPGVTVNLMDCSNVQLDTTTTDPSGNYLFDGLTPGNYKIEFVLPSGYSFSLMDQLADDSVDSDANTTSGMTACTTLIPDENDMTWDAGIYLLPPPPPGTGTPGYWKNHPEAWPVEEITIGGVLYPKAVAIGIMDQPVKGDKTLTMFPHLVSARLNVLIGNPDSCIADTITLADGWMGSHPPGSKVKGNSEAWEEGEPFSIEMDNYNNGFLCAPHRD